VAPAGVGQSGLSAREGLRGGILKETFLERVVCAQRVRTVGKVGTAIQLQTALVLLTVVVVWPLALIVTWNVTCNLKLGADPWLIRLNSWTNVCSL